MSKCLNNGLIVGGGGSGYGASFAHIFMPRCINFAAPESDDGDKRSQ